MQSKRLSHGEPFYFSILILKQISQEKDQGYLPYRLTHFLLGITFALPEHKFPSTSSHTPMKILEIRHCATKLSAK